MGTVLGVGISNLINTFNPQCIILGGRVSKASDLFLPSCTETVRQRAWYASTKDVKVSRLERGEVLGAAALVLQQIFSTGQIVRRAAGNGGRRESGGADQAAGPRGIPARGQGVASPNGATGALKPLLTDRKSRGTISRNMRYI